MYSNRFGREVDTPSSSEPRCPVLGFSVSRCLAVGSRVLVLGSWRCLRPGFLVLGSWFLVLGSCFSLCSWFMVLGLRSLVLGSGFLVLGSCCWLRSWFMVLGSWFVVPGYFFVPGPRSLVRGSWFLVLDESRDHFHAHAQGDNGCHWCASIAKVTRDFACKPNSTSDLRFPQPSVWRGCGIAHVTGENFPGS